LQTRMQVVNPSPTAVYTGISNAVVTISRAEGFRTLWKGLSSVVLGAGQFYHTLHFWAGIDDFVKVRRMQCISRHMRRSSMQWAAMKGAMKSITL
jgi:hypothetical protein